MCGLAQLSVCFRNDEMVNINIGVNLIQEWETKFFWMFLNILTLLNYVEFAFLVFLSD